jgi:hypothetical protein
METFRLYWTLLILFQRCFHFGFEVLILSQVSKMKFLTITIFFYLLLLKINIHTYIHTRTVCKVRGLTLLLPVGTLSRCGDGLFSKVPPLASDALLTTLHPLLENVLQTVDRLEISCIGVPFPWLEKPRNSMRRDLNWILCSVWKHSSYCKCFAFFTIFSSECHFLYIMRWFVKLK